MSTALCPGTCPAPTAITGFYTCTSVTRKADVKFFILIKCTYQFTDILDTTEWTTGITSGDIVISPPGDLDIPTPTQTDVQTTCDTWKTGELTYDLTWTSYEVAAGDTSDIDFYDTIDGEQGLWRIMWLDCNAGDERFAINRDWAAEIDATAPAAVTITGTSPGFPFSVIQKPHFVKGDGGFGTWTMGFRVRPTDNRMIVSRNLPGVAGTFPQ